MDSVVTLERFVPKFQADVAWAKGHFERYLFALEYISAVDTVLDIACGVGYGTDLIQERCKKATGIDRSKDTIEYAREHYHGEFLTADFFDKLGMFDIVVSFETIEHINQTLTKSISHLCSMSRKLLICSVPFRELPGNSFHYHFHIDEKDLMFLQEFGELSFFYQEKEPGYRIFRELDQEKIQNLIFIVNFGNFPD
jgi:SAM-dependent methyltransferase